MGTPPLHGLRVLEHATGIAGPYAGRLMASLGATVVKVEPRGGDPARRQQVDDAPIDPGGISPLYTHLNAGKLNAPADAVDPSWAHVVLSSDVLADLADTPLDPSRLVSARAAGRAAPRLVTVTAWGADAEDAGVIADELLVQTATGFLGFNGNEGEPPLRLPGWQSQYVAGGLASVAAQLICRTDSTHIDVSWLGALLTATELCYGDALHCQRPRPIVGAHPPTAFPSGAIPCKDGHVAPGSIRPIDWEMQCLFYGIPEWIDDPDLRHRHRRVPHVDRIWERVEPWYAERTKREIFQLALDSPWAAGMVMTPLDALDDEHLADRGYLGELTVDAHDMANVTEGAEGAVRGPVRPFRGRGLPVEDQRVRASGVDAAPDGARSTAPPLGLRRFEDLRVIEMTISWAGPYVGNVLGPLGVDIVKIEAQSPFDGFRTQRPYDHGMRPGQEDLVHDNRFYEAGGLFNAVNKGKRDCVVSLAEPEGREAFLELVRNSDALVANFSAHVLDQLGLDIDTLLAVNPRFVVVRMPAFGVTGPYSDAVGYGSIVEAMGGMGHRQGYEHEGARISNIYFPDPVAGIHAANALVSGLLCADVTGEGQEIDLSHQEAMWQHSGEALVLASAEGRDIGRMGNREPGIELSEFVRCADLWVAVVADGAAAGAARVLLDGAASVSAGVLVDSLRKAGAGAEVCFDPWTAPDHDRVKPRLDVVDHPVTGPMRHLASPFTVDGVRPTPKGHAPLFDQHTDEVFGRVAGLSADRIAALRAAGHIGGVLPPPAELGFVYD
jgi:crotonobetainyl-CoA:carnitine CoA-transferase CaiB-like acyl-CoA transferase